MRIYFLLFILIAATSRFNAQTIQALWEESVKVYEGKKYPEFLSIMKQLDSLRPAYSRFTYGLASAYALNSQPAKAFEALEKLVAMDNTISFETDSDFVSLQKLVGYHNLLEFKKELSKHVSNSKKVISLSEQDLHPEAIIYLPKNNIWLATSIRKKKIVSFDFETGACKDWLTDQSLISVFAMRADNTETYLWVAASAVPEMEGYTPDMEGKAEILKVEIASGKIVQRFSLEGPHVFGDLVVSKQGDVYISDSAEPTLYCIKTNKTTIDVFADLKNVAFNLQGLALSSDENSLFVADYLKGILKIRLNDAQKQQWIFSANYPFTKGIDGIALYKNHLVAIYNGTKPIQIIQYTLNDEQNKITETKILDRGREEFKEPTTAYVENNTLYFIGNSPWSLYNKRFELNMQQLKAPELYQCKIK